jgi:hypothetical protein
MAMKKQYKALARHLHDKLMRIVPSEDHGLKYYPCRVTLREGRVVDRVYVVEQAPYIRIWGVYPEDDRAKLSVPVEAIADLEESPFRLPPTLANKLYEAGESGMGYVIFTVLFRDGTRQAFATGNAVDFISFPQGKAQEDIEDVLPHEGRQSRELANAPDYFWCLYSGVE